MNESLNISTVNQENLAKLVAYNRDMIVDESYTSEDARGTGIS